MPNMNTVQVEFAGDSAGATTEAKKAVEGIDSVRESAKKAGDEGSKGLSTLKEGLGQVTEASHAVHAALAEVLAVLGGGAAFGYIVNSTIQWGVENVKLSRTLGLTADEATGLNIALGELLTDHTAMEQAAVKLTRQIRTHEDAFKSAGIATREYAGGPLRNTRDIMIDVNEHLQTFAAGSNRNAEAMKFYGARLGEIYPVLWLTGEKLEEAASKGQKLHMLMGQEGAATIREYRVAMHDAKESVEALELQIGMALLPELTHLAGAFSGIVEGGMGDFVQGLHSVEAEIIRMSQLADKAGGTLTTLGYIAAKAAYAGTEFFTLGNAGGNFDKDAKRFDELNKMYETRYKDGEKRLQKLANLEVGLDENGNPIKAKSGAREGGGMEDDQMAAFQQQQKMAQVEQLNEAITKHIDQVNKNETQLVADQARVWLKHGADRILVEKFVASERQNIQQAVNVQAAQTAEKEIDNQIAIEKKLDDYRLKTGAAAEVAVLQKRFAGERGSLEAKQATLSVQIEGEKKDIKRNELTAQYWLLEEQLAALKQYEVYELQEHENKLAAARSEIAVKDMEERLAWMQKLDDYQHRTGKISEEEALGRKFDRERQIIGAKQEQLGLQILMESSDAKRLGLIAEYWRMQGQINHNTEEEVQQAALLLAKEEQLAFAHGQKMTEIEATAQEARLHFIGQDEAALTAHYAWKQQQFDSQHAFDMQRLDLSQAEKLAKEREYQQQSLQLEREKSQKQAELWWSSSQKYMQFAQQMTSFGVQMLLSDEKNRSQVGKRMLATAIRFMTQELQQFMFNKAKEHLMAAFGAEGQTAMMTAQHEASLTMLETEATAWAAFLSALAMNPYGGEVVAPAAAMMAAVAGGVVPTAIGAVGAETAGFNWGELGMAAAWAAGGVLVGAVGEGAASAIEGGASGSQGNPVATTSAAGAPAAAASSSTPTPAASSTSTPAEPVINIHLYGINYGLDTDKLARDIYPAIRRAANDGVR